VSTPEIWKIMATISHKIVLPALKHVITPQRIDIHTDGIMIRGDVNDIGPRRGFIEFHMDEPYYCAAYRDGNDWYDWDSKKGKWCYGDYDGELENFYSIENPSFDPEAIATKLSRELAERIAKIEDNWQDPLAKL